MLKSIKINVKILNTLKNILVPLMVVAQAGILAYFLFAGVSTAFGERVNILSAITLTFSITKISSSALYKAVFGTTLGIVYFVFAIKMLKAFLGSIQYIKPSLKNIELNSQTVNSVVLIFESFGECFFLSIAYTIISRMISLYNIPSGVIAFFIVVGVLSFVARIVIVLIKHNDVLDALYTQIICYGIFLASVVVLLANVLSSTLYTSFNSFRAAIYVLQNSGGLVQWMTLIEQFAVNNVFMIIVQICVLMILSELLTSTTHYGVGQELVKKTLIFSTVTAVCHIVISAYIAYELGFDIMSTVINDVMRYAPLVILPGIAYYSFKFPTELVIPTEEDEKTSETQSDSSAEATSTTEYTTPAEAVVNADVAETVEVTEAISVEETESAETTETAGISM